MVNPVPPPHLSPEQRERLEQLVDAVRLRTVLYPAPKPPPPQPRARSRQYPSGRPNPWRSARTHRRRQK
ncbi:hypothetical protein ACPB9J_31305 [Streptomyces lavendulocolor]|uniref:hypothetical protein n=1 Tax=Streptomyces lavendulocolor TaxID=67316 RepID=UPI003C2D3EE9